jgi:hypothetical protein
MLVDVRSGLIFWLFKQGDLRVLRGASGYLGVLIAVINYVFTLQFGESRQSESRESRDSRESRIRHDFYRIFLSNCDFDWR